MIPVRTRTPSPFALAVRAVSILSLAAVMLAPPAVTWLAYAVAGRGSIARRMVHRRLAALLMRLGPAFVKAGQLLGTRQDVLSPDLCKALSVLHQSVAPLPPATARRALAEAYGPALTEQFAEIDYAPVASGSVACVYRARLRSGAVVALKLRRPGIDRLMALDLTLLRKGAAVVARLPAMRGLPVGDVVGSVCDAVAGQLDFVREAAHLARLRRNLAGLPAVRVPQVLAESSRPQCIAMEFIDGLGGGGAARSAPPLRRRFAACALDAIYQMLFVDGFVHCDMHPGNLQFTSRGETVVLDAGFSVQLSERLRRLFALFFVNMALGDGERCAAVVIESAAGVRPGADLDGFATRMADLVRRWHGLPAKEFSLIAFATEMFDLHRSYGVHAAAELLFPLLSLLMIEGTVRELDPQVDFQARAKPVVMRALLTGREAA